MTIGVLSDTHGNRDLMHRVADLMQREFGVRLFFHLGDDYADGEELATYDHSVRRVPGLWCPEYHDHRVPNCLVEQIEGITIAAVHADKDLRAVDRPAELILTGHTHEARIDRIGASLYVNPGHLKGGASRGEPPSFAVVRILPDRLHASIHETDGKLRTERTVACERPPAE
ncbi:MAG: metallophosphoesterase family protein [bacterium]|nr:metallophosphoesterase family protein [bacterium]